MATVKEFFAIVGGSVVVGLGLAYGILRDDGTNTQPTAGKRDVSAPVADCPSLPPPVVPKP